MKRLGQIGDLASGLTSGLAKQIIGEAEPAVRRIVRDERNRLAEALIGGIPFGGAAAIGYTATRYLVPEKKPIVKAVGYIASAATATIGAWWTFKRLTETAEPKPVESTPAGTTPKIVNQAATAIVIEAEPRVRSIVDDEKALMSSALQAGLPWAIGAVAVFLGTTFVVRPGQDLLKAAGYSITALLLGSGAWMTLEKTKEASSA
jgi:hypothetical protein